MATGCNYMTVRFSTLSRVFFATRLAGLGLVCVDETADPAIFNFYLDLKLGKTALKGIGDCRRTKSDFPERGLSVVRCFLDLSDPLGRCLGGQLT